MMMTLMMTMTMMATMTKMTMMATTTSCWRRDIAMLLDTLRPSEGSDLVIKVVTMMVIEIPLRMMTLLLMMFVCLYDEKHIGLNTTK